MKLTLLTTITVIATSSMVAHAQESSVASTPIAPPAENGAAAGGEPTDAADVTINRSLAVGYAHLFDASFGSGASGSVSENRTYASYTVETKGDETSKLGVSFNYSGTWYNFDGASPLDPAPGDAPWGAVTSLLISPTLNVKCDSHWNAFARVFAGFSGENSADVWDSTTGGGAIGASYSFSKDLTLGLGVLGASQIEDNVLVIPLLIVDWKICDTLRLTNVGGPAAYPTTNGLELAWRVNKEFELSFGGRWEIDRFRLDDDASNPNGVGQDKGLPMWIRGTWFACENARVDVLGGVRIGSEFNLYDQNGNGLSSSDVDAQPFLGVFVSVNF
ncbi:MAG: hypothetical protein EXS10_06240 [Phycisphaerales bacterium]|nr:hypothetical protein [Phycisphaerales bacterium]